MSSVGVLVPFLGRSISLHGDKVIDDGDKAATGLYLPFVSIAFSSAVVGSGVAVISDAVNGDNDDSCGSDVGGGGDGVGGGEGADD